MPRGGRRPGAGGKPGVKLSEQHRERIRTTVLLNRLQNFALGKLKRPMQPAQVTAALRLLAKRLPDLKAIEHSGTIMEEAQISHDPLSEEQWDETYGGARQCHS